MKEITPNPPPRHGNQQGRVSARLSRRERRLLFAYEDALLAHRSGRALVVQLGALTAWLLWLHRRGFELGEAWPQDLAGWRRSARVLAHRFEAVRALYRYLYCRRLLRHDPGAVLELPPRRGRR